MTEEQKTELLVEISRLEDNIADVSDTVAELWFKLDTIKPQSEGEEAGR